MAVLVLGRRDDGKRERWIPERRERSMDTPKAPIEPTRIYTPAETAKTVEAKAEVAKMRPPPSKL